jgi:hypothetical protein
MSLLLNPKAAPVAGGGNRVALLGTSLMQHHHTANSSFKLSTWSKGPLNWARTLNPGLFDMPAWYDPTVRAGWEPDGVGTVYFRGLNAGIGGAVLSEIWNRRFYLATNVECDVVVIDGGTNDIPTQTKEYIHQMRAALVDFYLALGKKVVLLPILARSTSSWSVASGYRKKAHWVNQQGFDYVAGRNGCYSLDWNKPWVDFNSADGSPKAGYSPDGTHFSTISAYEVGKELGNALKGFLVPRQRAIVAPDDLYDATLNPRGNLMPNPMLSGTAGTVGTGASGSVADNMRVVRQSGAGAVACSKVARSNGRGNAQQLVITPSGAAGTDLYYFQTAVTSVAHNLPVGTWVRASVEVDCGAWAGWQGITQMLRDGATGGIIAYGMEDYNADAWPAEAWSGVIETPPFQIIDAASTLQWRTQIKTNNAQAGTGTLSIGAVELRPIADPRSLIRYKE